MEKKKMTKEAAIELLKNRKVYVNGKSAEIQEKLFELGFEWEKHGKSTLYLYNPFLFTIDDKYITTYNDMIGFISSKKTEISAEEILAIEVVEDLKENDVVVCGWNGKVVYCKWIAVVKKGNTAYYDYKVALSLGGTGINDFGIKYDGHADTQEWARPATEEEKQILIDALKNSDIEDSKDILKEVFGVEECPFKPFDRVLVRNGNGMAWGARLFDRMYEGDYACTDSLCYKQCIPFEGSESLHGTADSPNNQKKEVE